MKKLTRLTALILALVMCFGLTAMATEADSVENDKMTISSIDGKATVTLDSSNEEIVKVTYASDAIQDGQFYLVMVITADGNGKYTPTKDSILYINQTTGSDGKISFEVYPSAIKDSAILIYGTNIAGEANSLIAAIIKAKYVIGDVNSDGEINVLDAILILQYVVETTNFNDTQMQAGNVDGQGSEPDVLDAIKILQFVVGIITEL